LKLKFQTVAKKTAKNFRGLLYFAAPGIKLDAIEYADVQLAMRQNRTLFVWHFSALQSVTRADPSAVAVSRIRRIFTAAENPPKNN